MNDHVDCFPIVTLVKLPAFCTELHHHANPPFSLRSSYLLLRVSGLCSIFIPSHSPMPRDDPTPIDPTTDAFFREQHDIELAKITIPQIFRSCFRGCIVCQYMQCQRITARRCVNLSSRPQRPALSSKTAIENFTKMSTLSFKVSLHIQITFFFAYL